MRKYCLQIVFIPINFSFIHRSGFWLIIKGNILEFCLYNHARWWLDRYSKVWNRIHSGGFLSFSSYVMVFFNTPSNTWQKIYAHNQFPGLLLSVLPKSTGKIQRLVPETLSRFPRPLSLEKFYVARWIDYQMAGWLLRD